MKEEEIGNCTLSLLIKMLSDGWRVKKMIYRGFNNNPYGEPCWTTNSLDPIVTLKTAWFELEAGREIPRRLGDRFYEGGWNIIVFEKEEE